MGITKKTKGVKRVNSIITICLLVLVTSCIQQKRYVSYKVQKGETMKDIAKKFNLKTNDLLRLNPNIGNNPDANIEIKLPKSAKKGSKKHTSSVYTSTENNNNESNEISVAKKELIKLLSQDYVVHVAKPKETMWSLKRFYNVAIEDIYKLNPGLKEDGLKIGQVVKIKRIENKLAENNTSNLKIYQDDISLSKTINVVYLMPLKAKEYSSKEVSDIFKLNKSKSKLVNMTTDFYMGSEIALDSLKKQGVRIRVQVLDTGNKGKNINNIINRGSLDNADVVIGPFYFDKARYLSNKIDVPIIYPHFSKSQNINSYPNIVRTASDIDIQIDYLVEHLSFKHKGERIFIIGDNSYKSNNYIKNITSQLKKNNISKINILKPIDGYIKKERFTDLMEPNSNSWVILATNKSMVIDNSFNTLIALPKNVTTQVFAIDKNSGYDKIDNNKLAKTEFTYVSNHYMSEETKASQIFNNKYYRKNYALPTSYAIKGFDITYDVLMRMASGDSLKDTFSKGASIRLENKFEYDMSNSEIATNKGLFLIQYNKDLSLKRIK